MVLKINNIGKASHSLYAFQLLFIQCIAYYVFDQPEASPGDSMLNAMMRETALFEEKESSHQIEDMLIKCVFNRVSTVLVCVH